jgi:hypothetical protein
MFYRLLKELLPVLKVPGIATPRATLGLERRLHWWLKEAQKDDPLSRCPASPTKSLLSKHRIEHQRKLSI